MAKNPGKFALQKICPDIYFRSEKEDMSGKKVTYSMVTCGWCR